MIEITKCKGCEDKLPLHNGLHHNHEQPVMRCVSAEKSSNIGCCGGAMSQCQESGCQSLVWDDVQ